MAAPTNTANVKKSLANSEPSTHGMKIANLGFVILPLAVRAVRKHF